MRQTLHWAKCGPLAGGLRVHEDPFGHATRGPGGLCTWNGALPLGNWAGISVKSTRPLWGAELGSWAAALLL